MTKWQKFLNWLMGKDVQNPQPTPPPISNPNPVPNKVLGVNVQGAFRSVLHPGFSEAEIIDRVGSTIVDLGFNSIRIGGTPMFGASYDEAYGSYGWEKYWTHEEVSREHSNINKFGDSYNYNMLALKMAKKYHLSVWLTFHRFTTQDEIEFVNQYCETNGIKIAGRTRDNEPYLPNRFPDYKAAYYDLAEDKFDGMHWPIMYIVPGNQPSNREQRQNLILTEVSSWIQPTDGVEIHCYYPKESGMTEGEWLEDLLEATYNQYMLNDYSQIMAGEWSGKNQETFSEIELNRVIQTYHNTFTQRGIPFYYQLIGSNNPSHGLWDFDTMTPNRGAALMKQLNQKASS